MPTTRRTLRLKPPDASILWFTVIFAAISFLVALIPILANDFWWHLQIGTWIDTRGQIPTTNLFAWTLPADQPFFYGAWLGEYLYGLLHRWGGLELIIFARNLMFMAALWLVGWEARRRSGSWRIAALAILLIYAMTLNNLTLRPQNWVWLPFVLTCLLLNRFADGCLKRGWLLLIPLLMAFWVNIHGSFVLSPALVGIFFCGEGLRRLLKQPGARSQVEIAWLAGVGLLTALAVLANPRGVNILAYVRGLMLDPSSQTLIAEWQSPTLDGIPNTVFFASILLLLVALIYAHQRPSPTDLLLTLAFLWLAWSGQRYVVWYAIATMPLLAQTISRLPNPLPPLASPRSWVNAVLCLLIMIPVLLAQPWLVESLPLPETYWQQVQSNSNEGPLVAADTPTTAAEHLQANPGGHLFNEMGYGSYLIWAVPEQGVFIDPRIELYPYQQWQDYIQISHALNYNALLAQYGADRILLSIALQPELASALANDPAWRLEYSDAYAQLWGAVK